MDFYRPAAEEVRIGVTMIIVHQMNGLSDKVSIKLVGIYVVFSKDSIIHIPDKEALALGYIVF